MGNSLILFFVVFTILNSFLFLSSSAQEISDTCIGCICHASTGCNKDQKCSDAGVCGPFLLTHPFWIDGGKFIIKGTDPSSPNAYQECASDLYCASETIRGYMKKYQKDCNNDGNVDCNDYARIHKFGPHNCNSPSFPESEFGKKFAECQSNVRGQ